MEEFRCTDIVARSLVDGEHADDDTENILSAQTVKKYLENGSLSDNVNVFLSSGLEESENKNVGHDTNTSTGITQTDGFENLEMSGQEFKSHQISEKEEMADKNGNRVGLSHNAEPYYDMEQQSNVMIEGKSQTELIHGGRSPTDAKGNGLPSKYQHTGSKSEKTSISVLGKGGHSCRQIQKSKHPQSRSIASKGALNSGVRDSMDIKDGALKSGSESNIETNFKQKKSMGEKAKVEVNDVPGHTSCGSVQRAVNFGSARSNHTVPQPFALATGKRASTRTRPADDEAVGCTAMHMSASDTSSSDAKNTRVAAKPTLTASTTKPSRSGNPKLNEYVLKPIQRKQTIHNEEDTCSVASFSATSVSTTKFRASSTTCISGFGSRCDERAEKRKEFFSKLDEKLHAKEVERSSLQAKTKDEKEAAIKELRKSLTFKASPMPSFYQESAPEKNVLKKIPPTRAKSPKLGRRKSCSGKESEGNSNLMVRTPWPNAEQNGTPRCNLDQSRTPRYSMEKSKINKGMPKIPHEKDVDMAFDKDNKAAMKSMRRSLTKLPSEKTVKESSSKTLASAEQDALNVPYTGSVDRSIGSGKVVINEIYSSAATSIFEEKLIAQESESIEEQKRYNPCNALNVISEAHFEDSILRESDSLIDTIEDFDPVFVAIDEDLQSSDGLESKINGKQNPL